MEEKSLKIVGADKTFLGRLTNTLTKMIMPTKIGLNSLIISMKRSAMLKSYANLMELDENSEKLESVTKKYDSAYASYLEAIDKYVMDSIYKKVKNRTANQYEENAISKYYTVTNLKESQFLEYKFRKQKYLIELDYAGLEAGKKDKLFTKYKLFYYKTMEGLFKGILKNYSVQLANVSTNDESSKNLVYKKIFETIEDYLDNVLPIKIEYEKDIDKDIIEQYDKYTAFQAGKLDKKDTIEKQMIILGISRKIFTHSLPLIVAEQCYIKLIKDLRDVIITSPNKKKEEIAYNMLINLIEEFNIKLLSTKIYWENVEERKSFKEFWDKYKEIEKNKAENYDIEKQVLFIQNELEQLKKDKLRNEKIIKFYKNKLVEFGEIRRVKNKGTSLKGSFSKIKKLQPTDEDIELPMEETVIKKENVKKATTKKQEVETKPKKRGRPKKIVVKNEE